MEDGCRVSNLRIYFYLCKNTILSIILCCFVLFLAQIITEININNLNDFWNAIQSFGSLLLGLLTFMFPLLAIIFLLPSLFIVKKLLRHNNFKMVSWVFPGLFMVLFLNILFFVAIGVKLIMNTSDGIYNMHSFGDWVAWTIAFAFFYLSSFFVAYLTKRDIARYLNIEN